MASWPVSARTVELGLYRRDREDCEQLTEAWGDKVTVVVRHIPESEDHEGSFEAVTMTRVPYNVSITGSDRDSAKDALSHLLEGLRSFGFSGRVTVEDATYVGGVQRYEIQAG